MWNRIKGRQRGHVELDEGNTRGNRTEVSSLVVWLVEESEMCDVYAALVVEVYVLNEVVGVWERVLLGIPVW